MGTPTNTAPVFRKLPHSLIALVRLTACPVFVQAAIFHAVHSALKGDYILQDFWHVAWARVVAAIPQGSAKHVNGSPCGPKDMPCKSYLEGRGDLVSIFITPISHIVSPIIPSINLLTMSP